MSNRLTTFERDTIRKRILAHAFEARDAAMEAEEHALAAEVYDHQYPQKIRDAMAALPSGFMETSTTVDIRMDGEWRDLELGESRPVASNMSERRCTIAASSPLGKKVKALHAKKVAYAAEKETRRTEVRAILNSVSTHKRLAEVWPEAKTFFADLEKKQGVTALAKPVKELNVALRLPPSSEAA